MSPSIINSISISVLSVTIILMIVTIHWQGKRISTLNETINGLTRQLIENLITTQRRQQYVLDPDEAEAYQLDLELRD